MRRCVRVRTCCRLFVCIMYAIASVRARSACACMGSVCRLTVADGLVFLSKNPTKGAPHAHSGSSVLLRTPAWLACPALVVAWKKVCESVLQMDRHRSCLFHSQNCILDCGPWFRDPHKAKRSRKSIPSTQSSHLAMCSKGSPAAAGPKELQ